MLQLLYNVTGYYNELLVRVFVDEMSTCTAYSLAESVLPDRSAVHACVHIH